MKNRTRTGKIALCVGSFAAFAVCAAARADQAAFDEGRRLFVERMVTDHDFERAAVEDMLSSAVLDERVLTAISRPAERVAPWYDYRKIFVTEQRINGGVEFWRRHADELERVSAQYGVPPEMIVAIIGVETFFGQRMGSYRVLDSLATLAFAYPPRSRFFSGELEALLLLTREEGAHVLDAKGSYAGAMGAGQFIPSSFRAYAVDGNGDGRRDLWGDWQDVLGSVANYFKVHGWRADEPVAVLATRTAQFSGPEPANGLDLTETVGSLEQMGYRFEAGVPASAPATVYLLEGEGDRPEYWVGLHNFYVITRYNRSHKYALAAYQLSQEIRTAYAAATGGSSR